MIPVCADPLRAELAAWSESLIADMIVSAYSRLVADHQTREGLVRCHVLLWRHLLGGTDKAETFRQELGRQAPRAGIKETAIHALNKQILAELVYVTASRFQRSPKLAGDYSLEIMRAACWLTDARQLAAA